MSSLNKVFLIGRLTRDPELRYTPKGTAVAEIALAVNRITSDEAGNKHEATDFFDVTLWGRTAEIAAQFLSKGSPCCIEARLRTDSWEDRQTGQKRSRLRIVGENLQLIGGRPPASASAPPPAPPRPAPTPARPAPAPPASTSAPRPGVPSPMAPMPEPGVPEDLDEDLDPFR